MAAAGASPMAALEAVSLVLVAAALVVPTLTPVHLAAHGGAPPAHLSRLGPFHQ